MHMTPYMHLTTIKYEIQIMKSYQQVAMIVRRFCLFFL